MRLSDIGATEQKLIQRTGDEEVRFENRFIQVTETPVRFPHGADGTYVRINPNTRGGVAIPRVISRGIAYYGLVRQHRFALDQVTLEFPRGGTDSTASAETLRELREETGTTEVDPTMIPLGTLHADTGVLATTIDVWLAHLATIPDPNYLEDETGATTLWVTEGELRGLINSGKITCGITLASYAKLVTSGRNIIPA